MYLKTQSPFLIRITLGLLFCTLVITPAQAQTDVAHNHGQTTKKTGQSKQRIYSCPMHPEVKGKSKGKCPKCGMDLRRVDQKEVTAEGSHEVGTPTLSSDIAKVSSSEQLSKLNIPDIELLDQNGRKIHFYTDLVKGKTVVINFIFTTCTTICPPLGATFARVQKELGDKAGRDVRLISISVDPATDTPERLKAWGAKFRAGEGWTFVTGHKPQVDELLRALGVVKITRPPYSSATMRTAPGRELTASRIPVS